MRAIWKGAVSFGLISIGVKLYSATEEKDIRFHQVHRTDGGQIRYKRVCSLDGEEVDYDEVAKGYDLGDGETVILTDEDFAELPLATNHTIDVLQFVPAEQVDPILYARSYYLEPEESAAKPYVLLRDALASSDRVAVVKAAIRQREQLGVLRVRGDVLAMHTTLWPDEVRSPSFDILSSDIEVRSQELAMARSLIQSMAADFEPEQFTDEYRAALQEMIDAKAAGREVVTPEPAQPRARVSDLMSALQASVENARQARSGSATDRTAEAARTDEPEPRKAPKKTADKPGQETATQQGEEAVSSKATPKKAAAKKTGQRRKSA